MYTEFEGNMDLWLHKKWAHQYVMVSICSGMLIRVLNYKDVFKGKDRSVRWTCSFSSYLLRLFLNSQQKSRQWIWIFLISLIMQIYLKAKWTVKGYMQRGSVRIRIIPLPVRSDASFISLMKLTTGVPIWRCCTDTFICMTHPHAFSDVVVYVKSCNFFWLIEW